MERAKLKITGMTCGHCVAAVKRALSDLPGVCGAAVTLDPPEAVVEYDPNRVTPKAMAKVAEAEGYPATIVA